MQRGGSAGRQKWGSDDSYHSNAGWSRGCNENFASQTNRQKQTSITTNTSASRSSGSVQNQNSCSRKTVVVQSRALCSCEEVGRGGLLLLRRFEAWRKKIKSRIERRYWKTVQENLSFARHCAICTWPVSYPLLTLAAEASSRPASTSR